jgi:hypothetical protein
MTRSGQKRYKLLRLPARKNTHEQMGRIVPKAVIWSADFRRMG